MKYEPGDVVILNNGQRRTILRVEDNGSIVPIRGEPFGTHDIGRFEYSLTDDDLLNELGDILLERIPPCFHSFVSGYAWEHGHSNGHSEILSIVEDLVWGIEKSLKDYKP